MQRAMAPALFLKMHVSQQTIERKRISRNCQFNCISRHFSSLGPVNVARRAGKQLDFTGEGRRIAKKLGECGFHADAGTSGQYDGARCSGHLLHIRRPSQRRIFRIAPQVMLGNQHVKNNYNYDYLLS
jgi:hypothetical protein